MEGHIEEDSVAVTPAMEEWLGEQTEAATEADAERAAAGVAGDESEIGRWGPVIDWPVVGIHMALLQNGKVLAYDSSADRLGVPDQSFTRATVWDPGSGRQTAAMLRLGFNIFCSGLAHLMDGTLFTAGGNEGAQDGIDKTYTFDEDDNKWTEGADMAEERWYPTVTPLQNGEMLITDGVSFRADAPEVRETDGAFRSLTDASVDLELYPWIDVAPDGRAFVSGPDAAMRSLDPSGTGDWDPEGSRGDSLTRSYGSHALYDIGKILVAGGGPSTASALTIDLNGAAPEVAPTAPMETGRRQHNLTVLADGTVLATGGNSSGEPLIDMENGVYTAELWDPATGEWTTLDSMQVTRQYHSSALLLPNGRVLSAGGGICGDCTRAGYLAKNAEVFTPPYLFKGDGSGELARRPRITSAPRVVNYDEPMSLGTRNARLSRQGGDGAAGRRHALGEHGAALRSALLHRPPQEPRSGDPGEPEHRAPRRLHAVRAQTERRAVGGQDDPDREGRRPRQRLQLRQGEAEQAQRNRGPARQGRGRRSDPAVGDEAGEGGGSDGRRAPHGEARGEAEGRDEAKADATRRGKGQARSHLHADRRRSQNQAQDPGTCQTLIRIEFRSWVFGYRFEVGRLDEGRARCDDARLISGT